MFLPTINWRMTVRSTCFLIISSTWNALATLYTRCDRSNSRGYIQKPLFTGICTSLLEASAKCSNNPLCDLFSKNRTHCSYHSAVDRTLTCGSGQLSENIFQAIFRPCNCTLMTDKWLTAGAVYTGPQPFYLFVTAEKYSCDQGQDVCMSLGGIMAEFHSIDEVQHALTLITGSVFIGGKLQGDKYVWATTGQEIDGILFAPGEPSHMAPCAQIWRNALDDTYLHFLNPILCQKRLQ